MLAPMLHRRLLPLVVGGHRLHQVAHQPRDLQQRLRLGQDQHGVALQPRVSLLDRPEDLLLRVQVRPEDKIVFDSNHNEENNVNNEDDKNNKESVLPDESTLSSTSEWLHAFVSHSLRLSATDLSLISEDVVLDNRMTSHCSRGKSNYRRQLTLYALGVQTRFAFVRCEVDAVHKDLSEGVVEVEWRVLGVGHLRTALHYVSMKKSAALIDLAEIWQQGVSTFHVDKHGHVFRHVIDNRRVDKQKDLEKNQTIVQRIEEKIKQKLDQQEQPLPT